jgi:hypothetical protein
MRQAVGIAGPWPGRAFWVAISLTLGLYFCVGTAIASDLQRECRAVQKIARITLSSKLVLSIADNEAEQSCDFFVSLPPPYASGTGVDSWFKLSGNFDFKNLTRIVTDIATSSIPKVRGDLIKDVALRIDNNSDLLGTCISKLFDKVPFDSKSKDGLVSCSTSPSLEQAIIRTVVADGKFISTVFLPRPVSS